MSSSSAFPSNPLQAKDVSEKLTRNNHAIWKVQVVSQIRGAQMFGHLTGAEKKPEEFLVDKEGNQSPNSEFATWDAQDHKVLSFLFGTLSREILVHVAHVKTAAALWSAIEAIFVSQTHARKINLRIALATTKKDNLSVAD